MSALTRPSKTKLFLLDPHVPAEEFRDKLWGALVKNPYKPTDRFSSRTTADPAAMASRAPGLLRPQASTIDDYAQVVARARHSEVASKLEGMLEAFWRGSSEAEHSRRGTRAEFWYMTSPNDTFRDLMRIKEYEAAVADFIFHGLGAEETELYFVTAMLTLADLDHYRGANHSKAVGAGAGVPNHPVLPVGAAVEARVEVGASGSAYTSGRFLETQIVAVGYHRVRFRRTTGFRAWLRRLTGRRRISNVEVTAIGSIETYNLEMDETMEEGDVPVMGSHKEQKPSGDHLGVDGFAVSPLSSVGDLEVGPSFEIISSYRERHDAERGGAGGAGA